MKIFKLLIALAFIIVANLSQANEYKYVVKIQEPFFRSKIRNNIIFIPSDKKAYCSAPLASKETSEFGTWCEGFKVVDVDTNNMVSMAKIAFGVGYKNLVILKSPPPPRDGEIFYFEEAIIPLKESRMIIDQVMNRHTSTF